ncbi:MAG: ABC transporter ATP-binding protein [Actinomycetota bacterium]
MTTASLLHPPSGQSLRPEIVPLVSGRDLTRAWGRGTSATLGLDRVDIDLVAGSLVAIVGPSGSGKSTLGALLAGIDRPTSGSLVIDGDRIDAMSDDRLARWRAEHVGIVFQDFHLLPTLTAQENVELAVRFADRRAGRSERRDRARAALAAVGLGGHRRRLPAQMSGGEQQRVAIARAIVTDPALVVADEPTGSLDQATGAQVFEQLVGLRDRGATVVFITHDPALADRCDEVIEMLDGRVAAQRSNVSAPSVETATAVAR